VDAATVRLFSDQAGTLQVASASAQNVAVSGTDVEFDPVTTARVVRVDLDSVSGTFYGSHLAALAEVEVIGSGDPEAVPLPPLPVPAGSELLTAGMILAVALCARRGDRMRRSRQV